MLNNEQLPHYIDSRTFRATHAPLGPAGGLEGLVPATYSLRLTLGCPKKIKSAQIVNPRGLNGRVLAL